MKDKTTIRAPRNSERPYFSVARKTAQDSSLSFEARGVLIYLLSKPDDWKVLIGDLMREGKFGRDKAKTILKELRTAGYIETENTHNKEGKFSGKVDRIFEVSRSTEKPSDGLSGVRQNHDIHNTESLQSKEEDIAPGGAKSPKPKTPRPRNPMFDAIATVFGYSDVKKPTRSEGSLIGKVANELCEAGYQPEQVAVIYAYCKAQGWKDFSAAALAAHAGNALRANGRGANPLAGFQEVD